MSLTDLMLSGKPFSRKRNRSILRTNRTQRRKKGSTEYSKTKMQKARKSKRDAKMTLMMKTTHRVAIFFCSREV